MTKRIAPTTPAPIAGVPVVLGGAEYIVPPLSLFHVRQFAGQLKELDLSGGMDPEKLDLIARVVHAALKRNYPEMSEDQVLELLDLGNVHRVFHAVMGIAGFAPAGGEGSAGE